MTLTVPADRKPWLTLGAQVVEWMQANLCYGPGDLRGQPLSLDAEQQALIWRMYELFPQDHPQAGRRRFKRVGLSLAKGLRKTELGALIAAAELAPDAPVRCVGWNEQGEPLGGPVTDPYVALLATTEQQSDELAFGALKCILEESRIAADFDIGLERILRKHGGGKAVSLANSPSARDGARTTFALIDESHHWIGDRFRAVHQTTLANLPKRRIADPWCLETTTAGEPGAGSVAERTHEYAQAAKDGRVTDSALFYFHRQASDKHDLTTAEGARAAVIEASGAAASWRDIDYVVGLWADLTTDRSWWTRVWTNQWIKGASQAFDVTAWNACARSDSPVADGDLITIGFDGAMFHDATALVACHVETGYLWLAGLWEKPATAGDDWQVPATEVDATVADLFQCYDVWRMYADPWTWQGWISKWAGEYGSDRVIEWFTNRPRQMAAALESFDTAMKSGALSHSGDSNLSRHIANARKKTRLERDDHGKPIWTMQKERPDSPLKIDAAMACCLAHEARNDAIAAGATQSSSSFVWVF